MKNRRHRRVAPPVCYLLFSACLSAPALPVIAAEDAALFDRRAYQLPAASLAEALNRFAAEAGVELVFDPREVPARQAPAVEGSFSVQEGFAQVLRGSGLRAVMQNDGAWRLQPVLEEAAVLPAVQVNASSGDAGLTENTGSYTTGSTNSATKLALTPRETPQTVNVITRQLIDDSAADNVAEILQLAPGVSIGTVDSDRNTYTARGNPIEVQYDGTPFGGGLSGEVIPVPDAAVIDRVEVLMGASGLMNGAGEPGGSVNIVWKRPTAEPQVLANVAVGSWDSRRLWVDVSGSMTDSQRVRGRVVAMGQAEESFRDIEQDKRSLMYVVLEGDLTETTVVSARVQFQEIYDNIADRSGLPAGNNGEDLHWDRESFLAPAWNRWDRTSETYWLTLEQILPSDWSIKAQVSRVEADDERLFGTVDEFDSVTGDAIFYNWAQRTEDTSDSAELYASGGFGAFGREHELVLGGNWSRWDWTSLPGDEASASANLYHFDPRTSVPQPEVIWGTDWTGLTQEQYGFYGVTRISFTDDITAILGGRVSWFEYEYPSYPQINRKEEGEFTPYAGFIYDLNGWSSAYVSYADIFTPQSSRGTNGATLDPVVGTNYEAGAKAEFYEGRLNVSVAIYRVEKTNEAQLIASIPYDPTNICGGSCYEAKGETVTDGFDLNISGELLPGWQVLTGYSQYHKDNYDVARIFKLSSSYVLPDGRWSFGGGIDSASKTVGEWGVLQDARTLLGVFGKYNLNDNLSISLNVDNLLDEDYYSNSLGSGYGNQFYGEPRSFTLGFHGEF